MRTPEKQPFTFTSEIVNLLIDHDWTTGVISGGGRGEHVKSFDELRAGRWDASDIYRIRSMDFVPGGHEDETRRHRFVLHAWDGYLDHMIETRREHGWKNEYTRTLAALATNEDWIGTTTMNPGAYGAASVRPGGRPDKKTLTFTRFDMQLIDRLIRDALIDTRANELQDFDF